ncbi:MAG: TetR/AcrR family transcriptional regulator [Tepidiformaceae bacterium]
MTSFPMSNRHLGTSSPARRDLTAAAEVASRDLVIAAAGELIRESGYSALTVDDVRLRAGVSRATFYFYFRNKTHLLISTASTVMDELFEVAGKNYPERDEFARIVLANVAYLSVWLRQSAILGEFYALSLVDSEVRENYASYRDKFEARITGRLARLLEQGRIPRCSPALLAASLSSMVEFSAFRFFCYAGDPISGGRSFTDLVETLSESWYRAVYGKMPGYEYDYAQHEPEVGQA